jgi:cytochrome P450/CRP-like cAMP-binding protein
MALSLDETRERLRELELFQECDDDDLDRVAALARTELTFEADAVLFEEGDPARDLYLIVEGQAEVTVAGRFLDDVGEGESIGELGLLDRGPRSARVVTRTPMTVQVIEAAGFDRLLDEAPSVTHALLRQVSRRLRDTNERVARLSALGHETTVRVGDAKSSPKTSPAQPAGPVKLDPQAPGFFDDPYAQYAALREHDPVHHDTEQDTWLLTRYDDVVALGRNKKLSVDVADARTGPYVEQERERLAKMEGRQSKMMFRRNPPEHTRLRRQIYKQFTPKAVRTRRPRLQALVDRTLDHLAEKGEADLIEDFAFPLPLAVISDLLGLPPGDDAAIRGWSQDITKAIDPAVTPAEVDASVIASDAMNDYLLEVIAQRRKSPDDALLSVLIAIADETDQLTELELVDQLTLLYIAGHETTVNLIGNGMLALLQQREQLERLRLDPALDANAVEELLRFDSPAQFTRRINREDLTVGDSVIPAGSVIFGCLGSANRDAARWGESADRVDVAREGANEHASLGGGIHHCLGASLLRLEAQVALGTLVRRFPRMELAGQPEFLERMTLRGLAGLRLTLGT